MVSLAVILVQLSSILKVTNTDPEKYSEDSVEGKTITSKKPNFRLHFH